MKWQANAIQYRGVKFLSLGRLISTIVFIASSALASVSVPLAWNPSPDPNAAGYKIYYGVGSHVYTNSIAVGSVTNTTITGLSENVIYYFAATTYDTNGLESAFSNEATYSFNTLPPALNPIAALAINENAGLQSVALSGLALGSGSALTVSAISSNPALIPNPTVIYSSPASSGSLTFSPAANGTGSAIITVTANNGQAQSNLVSQSFTVTVNPVYLPPALNPIAALAINENAGLQSVALSGLALGSGSALTVSAVSSNPALIPNPTVIYSSPASSGSLTFSPAANGTGSAIITVTANNGQAQSNLVSQSFTVTVNPVYLPPALNPIAALAINENAGLQSVALSGLALGSGSALTVSAVSSNPALIPNPTVIYSSPASSGSLTFSPAANGTGSAIITVTANNGQAQSNLVSQSFTVTVNPVYPLSTLDPINDLTFAYNAAARSINLTGITPGTGSALTITAVSSNPKIVPNPIVTYTSPKTNGSLYISPLPNTNGSVVITVTINDGAKTNNLFVRTFNVTVNPNQPPTLDPLSDLTFAFNAAARSVNLTGITPGAPGEVQNLTISAVSSNPKIVPNPIVTYTSPKTNGSLYISPLPNTNGSVVITVTINDGAKTNNLFVRTFNVTVNPNQPPTLDPLSDLTFAFNAAARSVNLTGITPGAPGEVQNLTISAVSSNPKIVPNPIVTYTSPKTNGSLYISPLPNTNGSVVITVTINDGAKTNNLFVRTFNVTVNPNQPPTLDPLSDLTFAFNAAARSVNLTGITPGAPGEVQNLTISAVSSNPKIVPNPIVTYTSPKTNGSLYISPLPNTNGSVVITVTINDGAKTNNLFVRTFNVTVNPNQPPTLDPLSDLTFAFNAAARSVNLTGITPGAPGEVQNLTISAVSSNPKIVPNPIVTYTSPKTNGSLYISPLPNTNGSVVITVTINDGAKTNNLFVRTFNVTVNPNQPPTLDPLSDLTFAFNAAARSVNLTGITPGAPGEVQNLTISAVSSNPKIVPNPIVTYTSPKTNGSLYISPLPNTNGSVVITVTINDGAKTNNLFVRTFNVTVNPNQPPTLDPLSDLTFAFNAAARSVNLTGITPGAPGEVQNLTISAVSSNPKIVPNPIVTYTSPKTNGSLYISPLPNTNGSVVITVTINDGAKTNNLFVRTFNVTVNPNQPPTLDPLSDLTFAFNAAARSVNLTGITPGAPGEVQNLTISAVSSNPKIVPNPIVTYTSPKTNGSLYISPLPNTNGSVVITVTINDGAKTNNLFVRTFNVTVLPLVTALTVKAAVSAEATLSAAAYVNGHFSFSVNGVPGKYYAVQSSADLSNWSTLQTNTTSSTFIFEDPNATKTQLFYRAVQVSP